MTAEDEEFERIEREQRMKLIPHVAEKSDAEKMAYARGWWDAAEKTYEAQRILMELLCGVGYARKGALKYLKSVRPEMHQIVVDKIREELK